MATVTAGQDVMISSTATIVSSLRSIVADHYGPQCGQTLMTSQTGNKLKCTVCHFGHKMFNKHNLNLVLTFSREKMYFRFGEVDVFVYMQQLVQSF